MVRKLRRRLSLKARDGDSSLSWVGHVRTVGNHCGYCRVMVVSATHCARCGAEGALDARFCSRCGNPLGEPINEAVAERRRVTVLFADLTGFTTLTERFDPEDVRGIVNQFFDAATEVIERWGGRIDQFLGDGILAVFGDRVAHEDDPERAVRAALEVHAATRTLRPAVDGGTEIHLTAHTGIATGVAVTADSTSDVHATSPLGDSVNLAARLQGFASADQIMICPVTHRLTAAAVDATSMGRRVVKGKEHEVEVFLVNALRSATTQQRQSALVGREHELATLCAAVDHVVASATGTAINVVAEAGGGKTRLFEEVRRRYVDDEPTPAVSWLEGRARAHGVSVPYAPVVEVIAAAADIDDADDDQTVRVRLAALVQSVAPDEANVLGPLLRLFGVEDSTEAASDRESYQARLTSALERLLTAAARQRPTVVCIQDIHWADPSTIALLRRLVPRLADQVLFLTNSRPSANADALDVTVVSLGDLSTDHVAALLTSRLGALIAPSLTSLVAERSGGNPFFAEEVLNSLIADDALVESSAGWELRTSSAMRAVPDTVQGVIAARIDLLSSRARTAIRHAAVFGREFTIDDLRALDPSDQERAEALSELERADLVRALHTDTAEQPARYVFKHALTYDVSHAGLTKHDRRRLHLAAAQAIEARQRDRVGDLSELLGAHYQEAGEVDRAVHHLEIAGRRALDRYAVDEANQHYTAAYRMIVDLAPPDQRVELLGPLLVRWVLVHYHRGTWRSATDLLAHHSAEVDAAKDPGVRGMALAWRGFSAAIAKADIHEATALLDEAIAIGTSATDPIVLAHAYTWRAWIHFFAGRHQAALDDGAEVERLLPELEDDRYPRIKSASAVGLGHLGLGQFAEAEQIATWMVEFGEETGSSRSASMGYAILSLRATMMGNSAEGAHLGRRAVDTAVDPIYREYARIMAVHGLVAAGETTAARAEHTAVVASCTELGLDLIVLAVATADGVLQVLEGSLSDGMAALQSAIDRSTSSGNDFLGALGLVYRASVRARAVTGEATVPIAAIARNPGFVLRHALPARRQARADLQSLLVELPVRGGAGLRYLTALELAKLLRHQRHPDQAAAVLESVS